MAACSRIYVATGDGKLSPVPDKPCLFCEIAAGRERAHHVYETDDVLAFLDIHPLFPGHVLVVPRQHFVHADRVA